MSTPEGNGPTPREDPDVDPRTLPPPSWPGPGAAPGPYGRNPYVLNPSAQNPTTPYAPSPYAPAPYAQGPHAQGPYPPNPYSPNPYPPAPALVPAYGPPPGPPPSPKPSALPTTAVPYQHLLRTPRHRWWKPLLTLVLFVVLVVVAINVAAVGLVIVGAARGEQDLIGYLQRVTDITDGSLGPTSFLFLNATLIILIPSAMLARWIVYRQRPRFLSSVAGGLRWRWQFRCLLLTLPIWAVYIGISTVVAGTPEPKPAYWGALIAVVLVTTPLQCAGEEYAFRGLVLQTVGAWFRRPMVALVVATVPAAALFAAAHGSPDPYILATLAIFSTGAVIVTWQTGGLEGAIAMHTANNVLAMLVNIGYGGWSSTFIGADTTGTLGGVLVELVVVSAATALICWQARRAGISRTFTPAAPALPEAAPVPSLAYRPMAG